MRLEDETRTIPKMTEIPSWPIPIPWRRKLYHPTFNTTSKFSRRATSRILQYYGETRMTKVSPRPPSPTQIEEMWIIPQEPPRRSATVADVPSNKEQHPLYPTILIPIGNPGMYPGCPSTTTTRKQKPSESIHILKTTHFRFAHKNQVTFNPPRKYQVNFDPHAKI